MTQDLVLYWFKRDFRLADNPALTAALAEKREVVPLFILEPSYLQEPETSAFHLHAITNALADLRRQFQAIGKDIAIIVGEVVPTLSELYQKKKFKCIYAHEEIGTARSFARDRAVAKWCKTHRVDFLEFQQTGVFRGKLDRDKRHLAWKAFMAIPALPIPNNLQQCTIPRVWESLIYPANEQLTPALAGYPLSTIQRKKVQAVSESTAESTLESFLFERGLQYRGGISSPLTAFTAGSRLSVHLAWGTITARTIYQRTLARMEALKIKMTEGDPNAGKWRMSLRSFLSRLHWRDHFIQRLEDEPQMEFQALNPAYEHLIYDNNPIFLDAWKTGTTGFPMVDACIRCLRSTGFVNFRMRAMITSFACHSLSLDWRSIHQPMAQLYTDYEPGIHLSQLQMQASVVGINTVRIYSPTKQIIDQDPEAKFIKTHVPELRDFTAKEIIEHTEEPLGKYPPQVIDWKTASAEMRTRIYAIRKTENYREIAAKVYEKHGSRKFNGKKRTAGAKKKVTPKQSGSSLKKRATTTIKKASEKV